MNKKYSIEYIMGSILVPVSINGCFDNPYYLYISIACVKSALLHTP
jgi:hypothetical protein